MGWKRKELKRVRKRIVKEDRKGEEERKIGREERGEYRRSGRGLEEGHK